LTGTITNNLLPKSTGVNTLGNSQIFDNGTSVGINTITPSARLTVTSSTDTTALFTNSSTNKALNGVVRAEYTGTTLDDHIALFARSVPSDSANFGIGLFAEGGYVGVQSLAKNASTSTVTGSLNEGNSRNETYGSYNVANSDVVGNYGVKVGTYGFAAGGLTNVGVLGDIDTNGSLTDFAGYFNNRVGVSGSLSVTGSVSKAGGTFKIDHPLDPENKFLVHSFVESPDMMNIYNGNIFTDLTGKAMVMLPTYFEAENKDFRYQLTCIGQRADAWIVQEVTNNQFFIETDKPSVKVSWQVTGIRKDKWAEANRYIPEPEKSAIEKGKFLHPLLYGEPPEKGIDYLVLKGLKRK
jgi:hypothetical protein